MDDMILNGVIDDMVAQAVGNMFDGSPRHLMEGRGYSSGRLYHRLRNLGFKQVKKGPSGRWIIPSRYLRQ